MNQILFINDKKGNGTDIKKIIKFFAIGLIIFGIVMVGQGSYALAEKSKEKNAVPSLSVQNLNDGYISIIVTHSKQIDSIVYSWNGETEEEIGGAGRQEIEEKIEAKGGTNTLKVTAIDIEGKVKTFENEYTIEDNKKPELKLSIVDNKIEVVANDETKISYITYRWNDENETKVEAEDEYEINEKIDIKEGTNKITVTAVDENNNMTEKQQEIKGLSKPVIEESEEEGKLVLNIKHEKGIRKIVIKFNGEESTYEGEQLPNDTQIPVKINLKQGDNHIDVRAYSKEDTEEVAPAELLNKVMTYTP